jgi:hypothetical protein
VSADGKETPSMLLEFKFSRNDSDYLIGGKLHTEDEAADAAANREIYNEVVIA